jgi:hypothetical protein
VATKEKTKGGYIPLYYDSGAINGTAENDLFIHSCNFGLLLEKQHPFHYPGDHDKLSDSIYYHHVALCLLACSPQPCHLVIIRGCETGGRGKRRRRTVCHHTRTVVTLKFHRERGQKVQQAMIEKWSHDSDDDE